MARYRRVRPAAVRGPTASAAAGDFAAAAACGAVAGRLAFSGSAQQIQPLAAVEIGDVDPGLPLLIHIDRVIGKKVGLRQVLWRELAVELAGARVLP